MESALMAEEFALGKILLFDKPLYWTSFDLVRKIKGILKNRLNLKKLKVGHAGTLDPLATGLDDCVYWQGNEKYRKIPGRI